MFACFPVIFKILQMLFVLSWKKLLRNSISVIVEAFLENSEILFLGGTLTLTKEVKRRLGTQAKLGRLLVGTKNNASKADEYK